ncbi:hypothetical protein K525DRAFT_290425 [Schizophyllum commune Loenen D]|nr:hypothetical protein K525DRAFT_290425 [Schizophyllum commune Loenen D]
MDLLLSFPTVDKKVRPVKGTFPTEHQVTRRRPSDEELFADMQALPRHPPKFEPTERLTLERLRGMSINAEGFLWPEEEKLIAHVLRLNDTSLAFGENQRGTLKESYFSPYVYVTVPHKPWEYKNIPIPPGIHDKVIELLREKIKAGVYEPSQSSYRSRWFCVLKKNGKLRIERNATRYSTFFGDSMRERPTLIPAI